MEECLKHTVLEYCNGDCPGKKSHSKVNNREQGRTHFNTRLKFKNDLLNYNTRFSTMKVGLGMTATPPPVAPS